MRDLYVFDSGIEVFGSSHLVEEFLQQSDAGIGDSLWRRDGERGYLRRQKVLTRQQTDGLLPHVEDRQQLL